jgi:hypothetical protein
MSLVFMRPIVGIRIFDREPRTTAGTGNEKALNLYF